MRCALYSTPRQWTWSVMSALGHKRTFRSAIVMSALPPKADSHQHIASLRSSSI